MTETHIAIFNPLSDHIAIVKEFMHHIEIWDVNLTALFTDVINILPSNAEKIS